MKAKQQSGFTLIELVMVIVILGILSAVAIPQFVNLQTDARTASAAGVAGALASASAINSATCAIDNAACRTVADCDDPVALLQGGALPANHSIGGAFPNCTVTHTQGGSAANWTAVAATDPSP